MNNVLLNKLKNDIDKKIEEIGGIKELENCKDFNEIITGWINNIIAILNIQEDENRFEMRINHTNYINCYFKVSFYESDYKAMCITLYGVKETELASNCYPICNCTVYNSKVKYQKDVLAIKEEYISIFEELKIINSIKSKMAVPLLECRNVLDYTDKEFAICEINQEALRKYCKEWTYKYE